jgi:hypothetical protein
MALEEENVVMNPVMEEVNALDEDTVLEKSDDAVVVVEASEKGVESGSKVYLCQMKL